MSRSEGNNRGDQPDTGKGTCKRPRGKKEIVTLEKPKQGLLRLEPRGLGEEWRVGRLQRRGKISNKEDFIWASQRLSQRNPPTM